MDYHLFYIHLKNYQNYENYQNYQNYQNYLFFEIIFYFFFFNCEILFYLMICCRGHCVRIEREDACIVQASKRRSSLTEEDLFSGKSHWI